MKKNLPYAIVCILFIVFLTASCKKTPAVVGGTGGANPPPPPPPPPNPGTIICANRDIISARLVQVGQLSEERIGLVSGTVGTKILFAGGMVPGAYTPTVDIYDTVTHNWSTARLTVAARQGMAVASVGTKIFFAGGEDADWGDVTSRIDIYDAATNSWSTAELSQPRAYLVGVSLGSRVYFAGGANWGPSSAGSPGYFTGSRIIDIYDNVTNTWTKDSLSEGRYELSATVVNNRIYFAGGLTSIFGASQSIDIFDATTNSWSFAMLSTPRTGQASMAADEKIFWVGGATTPYWNGYHLTNRAEIYDLNTGTTTFECEMPRAWPQAVRKDSLIVFFTGGLDIDGSSGRQFEIYNVVSHKWATGLLNQQVNDATIISVNNTIYVAGGRSSPWGPYFREVWKLEF